VYDLRNVDNGRDMSKDWSPDLDALRMLAPERLLDLFVPLVEKK
jgi:hypothetical protein